MLRDQDPARPDAAAKVAFQRGLYESVNPSRRYLHAVRRDALLRLVAEHFGEEGGAIPILEVGVGADTYGDALSARARVPIRLDLERAYLQAARATPRAQGVLQGDLLRLPFRDGAFRAILCSEVLEHLPPARSEDGLRELSRVLAPGGRIVFSMPQRYSLVERAGRLLRFSVFRRLAGALYGQRFDEEGSLLDHCNLLTRSELLRQARAAGLESVRSETCGLYLPGIAELGGKAGARLATLLDRPLRRTPLAALLWTQIHVLAHAGGRRERS